MDWTARAPGETLEIKRTMEDVVYLRPAAELLGIHLIKEAEVCSEEQGLGDRRIGRVGKGGGRKARRGRRLDGGVMFGERIGAIQIRATRNGNGEKRREKSRRLELDGTVQ